MLLNPRPHSELNDDVENLAQNSFRKSLFVIKCNDNERKCISFLCIIIQWMHFIHIIKWSNCIMHGAKFNPSMVDWWLIWPWYWNFYGYCALFIVYYMFRIGISLIDRKFIALHESYDIELNKFTGLALIIDQSHGCVRFNIIIMYVWTLNMFVIHLSMPLNGILNL